MESVWPSIRPTSEYDLLKDVVHRHYQYPREDTEADYRGDPAVTVPGYNIRFQLAREAQPHLWPHNARSLGFIQYVPGVDPAAPQPKGKQCLLFALSPTEHEYVHFAFLYKHPDMICDTCIKDDIACYHSDWDCPDQYTGAWPSPVTKTIIARRCYCCRTKGNSFCSNEGRQLMNLKLPRYQFGDYDKSDLHHLNAAFRNKTKGNLRAFFFGARIPFYETQMTPVGRTGSPHGEKPERVKEDESKNGDADDAPFVFAESGKGVRFELLQDEASLPEVWEDVRGEAVRGEDVRGEDVWRIGHITLGEEMMTSEVLDAVSDDGGGIPGDEKGIEDYSSDRHCDLFELSEDMQHAACEYDKDTKTMGEAINSAISAFTQYRAEQNTTNAQQSRIIGDRDAEIATLTKEVQRLAALAQRGEEECRKKDEECRKKSEDMILLARSVGEDGSVYAVLQKLREEVVDREETIRSVHGKAWNEAKAANDRQKELEGKYDGLSQRYSIIQNEVETLRKEMASKHDKAAALSLELSKVKQDREATANAWESERKDLKQETEEKERDLATIRALNIDQSKQIAELRKTIAEKGQEVLDLRSAAQAQSNVTSTCEASSSQIHSPATTQLANDTIPNQPSAAPKATSRVVPGPSSYVSSSIRSCQSTADDTSIPRQQLPKAFNPDTRPKSSTTRSASNGMYTPVTPSRIHHGSSMIHPSPAYDYKRYYEAAVQARDNEYRVRVDVTNRYNAILERLHVMTEKYEHVNEKYVRVLEGSLDVGNKRRRDDNSG